MNTVIVHKPHLLTKLEIWAPRYSSAYTETKERAALLAQYKVDHASAIVLVEFTKADHLKGQRYCIEKKAAQKYPIDSNGKIPCYAVPMSAFSSWQTAQEVQDIAFGLFPD